MLRDFFVRHLLGVTPPEWSQIQQPKPRAATEE
jgi:hypothetical protein